MDLEVGFHVMFSVKRRGCSFDAIVKLSEEIRLRWFFLSSFFCRENLLELLLLFNCWLWMKVVGIWTTDAPWAWSSVMADERGVYTYKKELCVIFLLMERNARVFLVREYTHYASTGCHCLFVLRLKKRYIINEETSCWKMFFLRESVDIPWRGVLIPLTTK